jgi:hypothetical protein
VRDEHMINRQGKQFVLYAGLLDSAHEKGLLAIDTNLIQAPTDENGKVAIVKASVRLKDGENHLPGRTFTGIGDASPDNVGRQIAVHLIRMAETRAKARALRDAVNVGAAILEEAGEGEEQTVSPTHAQEAEKTPGGASRKAAGKLWHLVGGKEGADEWQAAHGLIKEMSAKQVSDHINDLTV